MLLLAGTLLFGGAFLYYQNNTDTKLHYAKVVSTISSAIIPNMESSESIAEAKPDTSITEIRAILAAHFFVVLLGSLVIYLLLREKRNIGYQNMQVPLIAASIMLIVTVFASVSKQGLL